MLKTRLSLFLIRIRQSEKKLRALDVLHDKASVVLATLGSQYLSVGKLSHLGTTPDLLNLTGLTRSSKVEQRQQE